MRGRIAFLRAEALLRGCIDRGTLDADTLARIVPLLRQAASARVYDREPELLLGEIYFRYLAPLDFDLPDYAPLGSDLGREEALGCLRSAAEYGVHEALDLLVELQAAGESVAPESAGPGYLERLRDAGTPRRTPARRRLSRLVPEEQAHALIAMAEDGALEQPQKLHRLWERFRDGDEVEADRDLAMACLRAAARAGHPDALYDLGICTLKGLDVERDPQAAIALLEQADNANAHWALWRIRSGSDIAQPDREHARRHLRRAAMLGHGKADETMLAQERDWILLAKDFAEQGMAEATAQLLTDILSLDPERLRLVVRHGNRDASNALLALWRRYRDGDGLPRDLARALACLRAAAEGDHPDAHYDLGLCYLKGVGVDRDVQAAARWLARSNKLEAHRLLHRLYAGHMDAPAQPDRAELHRLHLEMEADRALLASIAAVTLGEAAQADEFLADVSPLGTPEQQTFGRRILQAGGDKAALKALGRELDERRANLKIDVLERLIRLGDLDEAWQWWHSMIEFDFGQNERAVRLVGELRQAALQRESAGRDDP